MKKTSGKKNILHSHQSPRDVPGRTSVFSTTVSLPTEYTFCFRLTVCTGCPA